MMRDEGGRPKSMFKNLRKLHGAGVETGGAGLNNLSDAFASFVTRARFFSIGHLRFRPSLLHPVAPPPVHQHPVAIAAARSSGESRVHSGSQPLETVAQSGGQKKGLPWSSD